MIDQPLNTYIKQPNPALPPSMGGSVAGMGGATPPPGIAPAQTAAGGANMTFTPIKKKSNKKVALIGGVLAFLVLAVAGVGIALKTGSGLFAPNAPQSNPGAATANTCSLNFTVAGGPSPSPSPSVELTDCTAGAFNQTFADNTYQAAFTKDGSGTAVIVTGKLDVTVPARTASSPSTFVPRYSLQTLKGYQGDFEASVAYPAFSSPTNNEGLVRLLLDSNPGVTGNTQIEIDFSKKTGNAGQIGTSMTGNTDTIASVDLNYSSQLVLKITRVGSTVSTYYNVGSGFIKVHDFTFADPVFVRSIVRSDDGSNTQATSPQVTATIDNFILACPTTTTYSCNTACTTDTQCQTALGAGYKCSTTQGNTCRLTANEASATCTPATTTYACNTACTTDAQCTGALGAGYKCSTSNGNTCRLTANESSTSCQPAVTYACNSTCDTDTQCQGVNADYVCSSAQSNTCRLGTNVTSATCTPATGTYACNATCTTNEQCASANTNYICASVDGGNFCRLSTDTSASNCQSTIPSPTPTIGCNETCVTNSDCTNPDHICNNNVCRLATNPTNPYCAPSTTTVTPTPGITPQPTLPPELPKTGPADWANALKLGLGGLGIGAVLLLFL